ncbi:hypothetical protein N8I77_005192 [Diaporthe amygdali]|uniref:Uncharacterized protein n=1 Tax=Phomopsis amygdali TaxID=1214568 RepID=A0AAD9W8L3_PHOAM|nr:hypothetical protein N8I77_005192 [Diaporthe amygdali]
MVDCVDLLVILKLPFEKGRWGKLHQRMPTSTDAVYAMDTGGSTNYCRVHVLLRIMAQIAYQPRLNCKGFLKPFASQADNATVDIPRLFATSDDNVGFEIGLKTSARKV